MLCTICDWAYLARFLVLARSLRRVCPSLPLHVVCLDEASGRYLEGRAGIITIPLAELEQSDPAVAATRRFRTRQRYAWTLKPASCLHLLRTRGDAKAVLFLDADLMFFSGPGPIFDELTRGSVALVPERQVAPGAWTPAGVRPELGSAQGATWGFYNSGTIGFRRDCDGLAALRWWREQCIVSGDDGGATGHEGYQWQLNPVPELFGSVRVIEHPGVGLAPWNARGTRLELRAGELLADGRPLVYYHYQSLRLRRDGPLVRVAGWRSNDLGELPGIAPPMRATIGRHWRISADERELLWQPYRQQLAAAVAEILREQPAWADVVGRDSATELAADIVGELRWRAYLAAGRILPPSARRIASSARARLRNRLTTPA